MRIPLLISVLLGLSRGMAAAADPVVLTVTEPRPFQVVQREGFEPNFSSVHEPEGPALGYADLTLRMKSEAEIAGTWEFRLELLEHGFGQSYNWHPLSLEFRSGEYRGPVEVPAGGWYRLNLRCVKDDGIVATAAVEPIGVGEVFLVAGQSYAGGWNDEVMKVADPSQAVSTYDWKARTWRVAHDPPPENGDGGSIWPPLGDMLAPTLRVPVAFVNVSVGATSTTKWLPETVLHKRLCTVGREIGTFRAVLWQQGESDVIEKTTTETYIRNMREIRDTACEAWGFSPPWLLAKSTLHPTVYRDPLGERRIRMGTDQLWGQAGFRPGPDTDVLGGENRGGADSKRHFSAIGQRRAALLWFAILWNELHPPRATE